MKKLIFCVLLLLFLSIASVSQAMITETIGEYSSPEWTGVVTEYAVGDFSYDLTGLDIVSASISGQWGNSLVSHSAHNEMWIDGVLLANTHDYTPDPYDNPVAWNYTFDVSEFDVLADGLASLSTIQTSEVKVRLAPTTLTIQTTVQTTIQTQPVPVPGAFALTGIGASLVGWMRRRKMIS